MVVHLLVQLWLIWNWAPSLGLMLGRTGDIVEGTKLGLGRLKKVRSDPFLVIFAFLSRLAFVSKQVSVPRCCFLRLASPTVPQGIRASQSGHSALVMGRGNPGVSSG